MNLYRVKFQGQFQGPFPEEELVEMHRKGMIDFTTPFQKIGASEWDELEELLPLIKNSTGGIQWLDVTFDHVTLAWTAAGSVARS